MYPALCCAFIIIRKSLHMIKWMSQDFALFGREGSLGRWPGHSLSLWQMWQQKPKDKYHLNWSCLIFYRENRITFKDIYLTCIYVFPSWTMKTLFMNFPKDNLSNCPSHLVRTLFSSSLHFYWILPISMQTLCIF